MKWKEVLAEKTVSAPHVPEFAGETIYPSLHSELMQKCNPEQFMVPYDERKVALANELYADILKISPEDEETLQTLRSRAIWELGICFSTKQLYQLLCEKCNPCNFMHPYDSGKVRIANELYALVIHQAYDMETLESIRQLARQLLGVKIKESGLPRKKANDDSVIVIISLLGAIIFLSLLIVLLAL